MIVEPIGSRIPQCLGLLRLKSTKCRNKDIDYQRESHKNINSDYFNIIISFILNDAHFRQELNEGS